MSELQRGSGTHLSRRQREQRAYRLVLATGGFGVATVVTAVLAIFGALGGGIPLIAAILTAVCWLLFRRTVAR